MSFCLFCSFKISQPFMTNCCNLTNKFYCLLLFKMQSEDHKPASHFFRQHTRDSLTTLDSQDLNNDIIELCSTDDHFETNSNLLLTLLNTHSRSYNASLINLLAKTILSELQKPHIRYRALILLIKITQTKDEICINYLAAKNEFLGKLARIASHKEKSGGAKGATFFSRKREDELLGINFVRLAGEAIMYWEQELGSRNAKNSGYNFMLLGANIKQEGVKYKKFMLLPQKLEPLKGAKELEGETDIRLPEENLRDEFDKEPFLNENEHNPKEYFSRNDQTENPESPSHLLDKLYRSENKQIKHTVTFDEASIQHSKNQEIKKKSIIHSKTDLPAQDLSPKIDASLERYSKNLSKPDYSPSHKYIDPKKDSTPYNNIREIDIKKYAFESEIAESQQAYQETQQRIERLIKAKSIQDPSFKPDDQKTTYEKVIEKQSPEKIQRASSVKPKPESPEPRKAEPSEPKTLHFNSRSDEIEKQYQAHPISAQKDRPYSPIRLQKVPSPTNSNSKSYANNQSSESKRLVSAEKTEKIEKKYQSQPSGMKHDRISSPTNAHAILSVSNFTPKLDKSFEREKNAERTPTRSPSNSNPKNVELKIATLISGQEIKEKSFEQAPSRAYSSNSYSKQISPNISYKLDKQDEIQYCSNTSESRSKISVKPFLHVSKLDPSSLISNSTPNRSLFDKNVDLDKLLNPIKDNSTSNDKPLLEDISFLAPGQNYTPSGFQRAQTEGAEFGTGLQNEVNFSKAKSFVDAIPSDVKVLSPQRNKERAETRAKDLVKIQNDIFRNFKLNGKKDNEIPKKPLYTFEENPWDEDFPVADEGRVKSANEFGYHNEMLHENKKKKKKNPINESPNGMKVRKIVTFGKSPSTTDNTPEKPEMQYWSEKDVRSYTDADAEENENYRFTTEPVRSSREFGPKMFPRPDLLIID